MTTTREIQQFALKGMIAERDALNIRIIELGEALGIAALAPRSVGHPRKEEAPWNGPQVTNSDPPAPKMKRSVAVRRKMAAAQKARWAKAKGEESPAPAPVAVSPKPRKYRMSAAGRKKIAMATKARWEKARAAGATNLKPVAAKKRKQAAEKSMTA